MTSHQFAINSDGHPEWTWSTWRVVIVDGQITIPTLFEDNPIDPPVVEETMRSIVAEIVAGGQEYCPGLTDLVRTAEHYRRSHQSV